jgi:primosomal protein N'
MSENNKRDDKCPNCEKTLVYNHYNDSMECLFCDYRHHISQPAPILDEENLAYSVEDNCDYGDYCEQW